MKAKLSTTLAQTQKSLRSARAATVRLQQLIAALSRRTVALAASNVKLRREVIQRKATEEALRQSDLHYSRMLKHSDRQQKQLRHLSRQILSAQEEERKEISRELHDVIAQTLTSINLRLGLLKKQSTLNTKGLDRNIALTQKLVEKAVNIVHQFARELRPAVLDDLGLVPALHSFMKSFTERTGILTRLSSFSGVENLDTTRRTVLFRVAQEALTNVARHAHASKVEASLRKLSNGSLCMRIHDNGKAFEVSRVPSPRGRKHLGLLGMRERVEMVGGHFDIASAPGKGTTVIAQIPFGKAARKKSPISASVAVAATSAVETAEPPQPDSPEKS